MHSGVRSAFDFAERRGDNESYRMSAIFLEHAEKGRDRRTGDLLPKRQGDRTLGADSEIIASARSFLKVLIKLLGKFAVSKGSALVALLQFRYALRANLIEFASQTSRAKSHIRVKEKRSEKLVILITNFWLVFSANKTND